MHYFYFPILNGHLLTVCLVKQSKRSYSFLVDCCPISDFAQYLSPLPNTSDIGQAADQTTVLSFPPRILVYVSLTIMKSNYIKTYKPVHRAQLKKTSFNPQTFQWRSISRWFDQQRVGWQKSRDVISGHLGYHTSKLYSICCSSQA